MALPQYIFDASRGETPETLEKRRRIARALFERTSGQAPRNVGEGFSAIGNALAYRFAQNRLDRSEAAGKASADSSMSRLARALYGKEQFPEAPKLDRVGEALFQKKYGKQAEAEVDTSLDRTVVPEDYYAAAEASESNGNRFAKNPRSSATGPFQFIDSTWRGLAKRRPDLALTPDGRTDPAQAKRAMRAFTEENADVLSSAGIPIDGGSLYAAHFLGSGGARNVLTADPGASVASIVGSSVVNANPFLKGMTVADFQKWAARKGGGNGRVNLGGNTQVASLDPSAGLPEFDQYGNIPAVDGMGQDQRAKFRAWNSDPAGNEARNMQDIDPALSKVVERAKQIAGTNFVLGSGRRDQDQQKVAIANGWSGTMDSDHLTGGAADLWPVDENGAVIFDPQKQGQIVTAMKQAAQELGVDMEAGADWRKKDMPHFGMTNQTPMDNAPIPTPRPGGNQVASLDPSIGIPPQSTQPAPQQTAGLFIGTPEEMAAQNQPRVPPQMLDPNAMGPRNGLVPPQRGQQPPQTVRAPAQGNPVNQPGPMRTADAGPVNDTDALAAFGAEPYDAGQERMSALMDAYRNGYLSDDDRALVKLQLQQELDARDPQKQLQALKARMDIQNANAPDWKTFESEGNVYRWDARNPNSKPELLHDGPEKPANAPNVIEAYDENGQPQKLMWDANQGSYVPLGGSKAKGNNGLSITMPDGTQIQQGSFDKQDSKNVANRVTAEQDAAASASDIKSVTSMLREANKGVGYSGPGGSIYGMADNILEGVGSPISLPGNSADRAMMTKGSIDSALTMVGKTKGAISNAEMSLFMAASPGLQNTPTGNAALLDMMDAIADRQTQRAAAMEQYRQQSGGTLDGFEKQWADYVNANPLIIKEGGGIRLNVGPRRTQQPEGAAVPEGGSMKSKYGLN